MYVTEEDAKYLIQRKVDLLAYFGKSTGLESALEKSRTQLFVQKKGNDRTPRLIVLITDGVANEELDAIRAEVQQLDAMSVKIFIVGIGKYLNEESLSAIASQPLSQYMLKFKDISLLKDRINQITLANCNSKVFF